MIEDRVRGIGNLTTACQCLIALVIFWLWRLIYSQVIPGEGLNPTSYGGYSLLIVMGLVLESLLRDRPNPAFPVREPSIIPQIPRALRQTAVAIGCAGSQQRPIFIPDFPVQSHTRALCRTPV